MPNPLNHPPKFITNIVKKSCTSKYFRKTAQTNCLNDLVITLLYHNAYTHPRPKLIKSPSNHVLGQFSSISEWGAHTHTHANTLIIICVLLFSLNFRFFLIFHFLHPVSPSVKAGNQLVGAPVESHVMLQCIVEAFPTPLNGWYKHDGELSLFLGVECLVGTL